MARPGFSRTNRVFRLTSVSLCSCSSADINPIGGISKTDLKRFIAYGQTAFDMPILERYAVLSPSHLPDLLHDTDRRTLLCSLPAS